MQEITDLLTFYAVAAHMEDGQILAVDDMPSMMGCAESMRTPEATKYFEEMCRTLCCSMNFTLYDSLDEAACAPKNDMAKRLWKKYGVMCTGCAAIASARGVDMNHQLLVRGKKWPS